MAALVESTVFELGLSELEATVDDQVVADQDGGVTLARSGCGSTALGALPGHDLKVKDINVIIIILTVPASEHVHFGSADNIS